MQKVLRYVFVVAETRLDPVKRQGTPDTKNPFDHDRQNDGVPTLDRYTV